MLGKKWKKKNNSNMVETDHSGNGWTAGTVEGPDFRRLS